VTPPPSAESVGRVAEDQVQQGNVELKDSLQESGIIVWLSATFFAVVAITALFGIVIYLFIRWRHTGQRMVPSLPQKDSEGAVGLREPSESITMDRSVVDNVARLAKLYAMCTPSEKEFQRLKELISHSIADSQEARI
jgi:hypothetical protein